MGTIMSTFQLTFIPGGVALVSALANHDSCADGGGCDNFLTWAKGAAASTRGAG